MTDPSVENVFEVDTDLFWSETHVLRFVEHRELGLI